MKFTRSNFKLSLSATKYLRKCYWEERDEKEKLLRQYQELQERHINLMLDYVVCMKQFSTEKMYEIDLFIQKEKSDLEYLSRQSLYSAFVVTDYRSN